MIGPHLPYRVLRSKALSWLTHARQAQIPISRYEPTAAAVLVRPPAARSRNRGHAARIPAGFPTLKQLASLLVDGILTLPPYYRRGMYLDLLV